MADKHITEINKSWVNVLANLDDGQCAVLTDNENHFVWRVGTDYFWAATSRYWDGAAWVYTHEYFDEVTAYSNLTVGEYIFHYGDANTYIKFDTDEILLYAGGVQMIDIVEAAQDIIYINAGQADVDLDIKTSGSAHSIFVDGDTGYTGFNTNTMTDAQVTILNTTECLRLQYDALDYLSFVVLDADAGSKIMAYGDDGEGGSSQSKLAIGNISPVATLDVNGGARVRGQFYLLEEPAAAGDYAGYGQLWVKNTTPNVLMFTDDTGNDEVIMGRVITVTAAGPTDNLDLTGVRTVLINTNSNNVTIGGAVGGVAGQVVFFAVVDATNDTTLENIEGTGNQDFYMHSGSDETRTSEYGGWIMVCDGSSWYDVSHSAHV